MAENAPIILFVYNRPDHTRQTLEALSNAVLADKSELIVFADGPKANCTPETLAKIQETRDLLKEKQWCGKVTINESSENKGLAANIISGVTEVVNKYGKVIVLEDDIVIGKHFLEFMNDALNRYNDSKEVMHIAGFRPEIKTKNPNGCFFYPNMDCWGWATWADRWQYFEKNTDKLINTLNEDMIYRFNMNGAEPGNWQQVLDNKAGKINTWAIYWLASIFLKNGLCLAPCKSLCKNVGFDGTGVHCGTNEAETIHGSIDHQISVWPDKLQIDSVEYVRQMKFFRKKNKGKFSFKRLLYKLCPSFIWKLGKRILEKN